MSTATLNMNAGFQLQSDLFVSSRQDKLFIRILAALLAIYLILAVVVPLLEQVEVPREVKEQLPPQLAKVMLQEKQLPIPEKIIEPEIVKPEEIKEELKAEPDVKPEKPIEQPKMTREAARKKAQTSGLAAMKDELFSMREAFDVKPAAKTKLNESKTEEVKVKRSFIAAAANKQSESIIASTVSKTVVSDQLSTKNTQHIRLAEEEVLAVEVAIAEEESVAASAGQRTEMSIRRTLEANKSRLYALYNRALRRDPFLKGKVMFEIEIQPNGIISQVDIKSSGLNNSKLERQLTVILRSIRFSEEDVSVMTTIWAIEFLPN